MAKRHVGGQEEGVRGGRREAGDLLVRIAPYDLVLARTSSGTETRGLGIAAAVLALLLLMPNSARGAETDSAPVVAQTAAAEISDRRGADATRRDSSGDAVDDTIREIMTKEGGRFDLLGTRRVGVQYWREGIERRHGLAFGLAYTVLYQRASRGRGPLDAAVGDLDLFGRWRAFGAEDVNAGELHLYTEWRHLLGTDIAPFNLSKSLGTLLETTTGFTNQPFAVTQLYWEQAWGRGRWSARLGKTDPAIFYFGNRINNANTYFVGFPFSDNPAVFYPGSALGASMTHRLSDTWSITAGIQDANGEKLGDAFQTIREGELWWAGQLQHTRCVSGLGVGNYRMGSWYVEP